MLQEGHSTHKLTGRWQKIQSRQCCGLYGIEPTPVRWASLLGQGLCCCRRTFQRGDHSHRVLKKSLFITMIITQSAVPLLLLWSSFNQLSHLIIMIIIQSAVPLLLLWSSFNQLSHLLIMIIIQSAVPLSLLWSLSNQLSHFHYYDPYSISCPTFITRISSFNQWSHFHYYDPYSISSPTFITMIIIQSAVSLSLLWSFFNQLSHFHNYDHYFVPPSLNSRKS